MNARIAFFGIQSLLVTSLMSCDEIPKCGPENQLGVGTSTSTAQPNLSTGSTSPSTGQLPGNFTTGQLPGNFTTNGIPTGNLTTGQLPGNFTTGGIPTGNFTTGGIPTGNFTTGGIPTGSTGTTPELPPAELFGDCPTQSELAHANPVRYTILAKEFSPFSTRLKNQIITNQADWDSFRAQNDLSSQIKLPTWAELPDPQVAVLSTEVEMAGCNATLGELALRKLGNRVHLDLGVKLNRSGKASCMGTCAASIQGFVIVSFDHTAGSQTPTVCRRIWPSCPLSGTVSDL